METKIPLPVQPQRRRRRSRPVKKSFGERALGVAIGAAPLLLLALLVLFAAGVVRVVEQGAASQANRKTGDRPRMETAAPVDATNQALRPVNQPIRNEAAQMLGSTPTANPKVQNVAPRMQDQVVDLDLMEDIRKREQQKQAENDALEQHLGQLLDGEP